MARGGGLYKTDIEKARNCIVDPWPSTWICPVNLIVGHRQQSSQSFE